MLPYRFRRLLIIAKDYLIMFLPIIAGVVILFLLIFSINSYFSSKDKNEAVISELDRLELRINNLKKGKNLVEDEIDEINQLFSILIPDKEDFFSIIYALEKISQESGFTIDEYSIAFGGDAEKIPISINGTGDIDSFLKFLQTYQFAGGRFATSKSLNFSNSKFSSTKVNLTFYNKRTAVNAELVPKITDKDIEFVKNIKKKIKIDFKATESNDNVVSEEYKIKKNPFGSESIEQVFEITPSPQISP